MNTYLVQLNRAADGERLEESVVTAATSMREISRRDLVLVMTRIARMHPGETLRLIEPDKPLATRLDSEQVVTIRRVALYEPKRITAFDAERILRMLIRDRVRICLGLDIEADGVICEDAVRLMLEVYYRGPDPATLPVILRVKETIRTSNARTRGGRSFGSFTWNVAGEIEAREVHRADFHSERFLARALSR